MASSPVKLSYGPVLEVPCAECGGLTPQTGLKCAWCQQELCGRMRCAVHQMLWVERVCHACLEGDD